MPGPCLTIEGELRRRQAISLSLKGRKKTPEHIEHVRQALIGKHLSEEHKKKIGEATKKYMQDETIKKKHKDSIHKSFNSERVKKLRSDMAKKRWENPEYAKKVFVGNRKPFNNLEKEIDKILWEILPGEYVFTGDGSMPVEHKKPDFTNIKGQNKLIDVYGTNPHADPKVFKAEQVNHYNRTAEYVWKCDEERLKILQDAGYKVLIIWQSELKDINKLKEKIIKFNKFMN